MNEATRTLVMIGKVDQRVLRIVDATWDAAVKYSFYVHRASRDFSQGIVYGAMGGGIRGNKGAFRH